ncbi:hypothetical protein [Aquipseudomonas guryensis]|jgi:hypothetical protein|uniref:Uncharacterized protein n=1 Tax=Aquipseudomonas guryensis TaxID=2759165 RepID=A0A7W4H449_9GAMM|nr:hypothetical protein [Pseudomonas guryensis]MBB1520313.1 hypothetical protein [Pseudomonas guryensis]
MPYLLLALTLPVAAGSPQPLPEDLAAFIQDYENCEHFSGEEPYDEERRAFLNEQIEQSCTDLETQRRALSQRYAGQAELLQHLHDHPPL